MLPAPSKKLTQGERVLGGLSCLINKAALQTALGRVSSPLKTLNDFSPGFLFQMEMSSGVAGCLCTLHALIVEFLFLFFLACTDFVGNRCG